MADLATPDEERKFFTSASSAGGSVGPDTFGFVGVGAGPPSMGFWLVPR